MAKIFNFGPLFKKFEVSFARIPSREVGGFYDYDNGGQWVPGPEQPVEDMTGIVLPLSNDDLRMDGNGTYKREDLKVYVREPLALAVDDRLLVRGKVYRVLDERLYQPEYADFNGYTIRRTDIEEGAAP